MHVIAQFVLRDLSALDGFPQLVAIEILAGLLLVETGMRGFCRGVSASPIREHESFEMEILLQDVGEKITVLAGVIAIDAVVGTHHAAGVGDSQGDLKGEKIGFAHRTLVDVGIDGVAPSFLIVHGVVLEIADDMLRLDTIYEVADESSGQKRIFPLVLKGTAVAGLARKIHATTQRHAVTLSAQLAANESAVLESRLRIPG